MTNTSSYLPILKKHLKGEIRGNALITRCPSCNKDNHFYVYANPLSLNSLCYVCGYKIYNYSSYIADYNNEDYKGEDTYKFVPKKLLQTKDLPAVYTCYDHEFAYARNYLSVRGIEEAAIKRYNLSLGKEAVWKYRIVFYIMDEYGGVQLVGGRSVRDDMTPRYYYPSGAPKSNYLFNIVHIDKSYDYCVIMEGVFDVICSRIPNAVALMGSTMSKEQENLLASRFKNFVVWLDNPFIEPAAYHKAHIIAKTLLKYGGVKMIMQQEGKDPGDCPDTHREMMCAQDYSFIDWTKYNLSKRR
jgi:hypothetical protein